MQISECGATRPLRGGAHYSQLQHAGNRCAIVESVVQLNDAWMMQPAHDANLALHIPSVLFACAFHEFGSQLEAGAFLLAYVHRAVCASVN